MTARAWLGSVILRRPCSREKLVRLPSYATTSPSMTNRDVPRAARASTSSGYVPFSDWRLRDNRPHLIAVAEPQAPLPVELKSKNPARIREPLVGQRGQHRSGEYDHRSQGPERFAPATATPPQATRRVDRHTPCGCALLISGQSANLSVLLYGESASLLTYECRAVTTDPGLRRRFLRCWWMIRTFVAHILRATLRQIRANAEASSTSG